MILKLDKDLEWQRGASFILVAQLLGLQVNNYEIVINFFHISHNLI